MPALWTLENTGSLIVAHVKPGSYIVADGVRYDLQQFEFHHPSESAVNGKLTDMDVELLHKSSDGKMAIIEVRMAMDRGSPNAVLAMLWPHLPKTAGQGKRDGHGQSGGLSACRPRLLDLYGFAAHSALHGGCALVCL